MFLDPQLCFHQYNFLKVSFASFYFKNKSGFSNRISPFSMHMCPTCLWLKTRANVQKEGSGIRGENSLPNREDSRPRKVSFSPCRNTASRTIIKHTFVHFFQRPIGKSQIWCDGGGGGGVKMEMRLKTGFIQRKNKQTWFLQKGGTSTYVKDIIFLL